MRVVLQGASLNGLNDMIFPHKNNAHVKNIKMYIIL
jgi:hypothetical protein